MTSRRRQWFDYILLYSLFLIARPLPRRALLALGRGLGALTWGVFRYRRGVVLDNLRHAFQDQYSEDEIHDLARRFYAHLGMTLMEFLIFPRLKRKDFLELVEVQGFAHAQMVTRQGRGGLVVTGHFGNWELLAARGAAAGFKVTAAAKTQSNARVDRIQNQIRRRAGVGIMRTDSGVKAMLQALRRGEMIALVADQDAGGDGFFTDFMGRPASFFKGAARFAFRAKVPLVTVFIFRLPGGRHRVVFEPPAKVDPQWDEETAIAELTRHYVDRLEAAIRQAPEQYFWIHRRWKTSPPTS